MVILSSIQEKLSKVERALSKWREMRIKVKMERQKFERMYLDSKQKVEPELGHQESHGLAEQPLSEFEKNLENRKALMLKEINYDLRKLNETEGKLRAVSEIMTVFSQKVIEQGTMTEQSEQG